MKKEDRIGEVSHNSQGIKMTIIDYINHKNVVIEFEDGERATVQYGHFKRGSVKCKSQSRVFGVGNSVGVDESLNKLPSYDCWYRMLRRCYDRSVHVNQPTYKDCEVSKEWLSFANFKKWYDDNYYEIDGKTSELDKDIICKNNKVYSAENCIFVPKIINAVFTKSNKRRGDHPIGVSFNKSKNKYEANIRINGVLKYLGAYNNPTDAFLAYKKYKENYIKYLADTYKDKIPAKLYKAMYDYTVDIND